MHIIYGECRRNASAAARLYRERYPNVARHPDHRVFIYAHLSYSQGRLPSNRTAGGRPQEHNDDVVLNEIESDPNASVRTIERSTGIPKSIAHRILQQNNYHPYHVQRVQSLLPRDYAPRVEFCRTMLAKNSEDPQFLNHTNQHLKKTVI